MAGVVGVHSCLMRVGLILDTANSKPTDQWVLPKLQSPFLSAYASCIKLSAGNDCVCLAHTTGGLSCTHPLRRFEIQNTTRLFIYSCSYPWFDFFNQLCKAEDEMVRWPIINSIELLFLLFYCMVVERTKRPAADQFVDFQ